VVVHLESGEDVVIVAGTAEDLGAPAGVPEVVAALSANTPARATSSICRTPMRAFSAQRGLYRYADHARHPAVETPGGRNAEDVISQTK